MGWPARDQYDAITESADQILAKPVTLPDHQPFARPLTPRECEVLQLAAEGDSNKAIGAALGISPLTVKSHLARIGDALHTDRRERMVFLALRAGYIQ